MHFPGMFSIKNIILLQMKRSIKKSETNRVRNTEKDPLNILNLIN